MDRLRRNRDHLTGEWRVCLECGDRYQAGKHGYRVNWCSTNCQDASIRRQRKQIETTWMKTRWFLR